MYSGDGGINAPISSVQLGNPKPLCKHTTPYATPSATWTAGQTVAVKFSQAAAIHSGGHCEFSISYDNGKTFAVIHQELRYCFVGSKPASVTNDPVIRSYEIKLPANLPSSDKAVFAWTWVNASGNREFYMNCADVAIKGGSSTSYTGKEMTIANYPNYPTIPEFKGNYDTGMEYYTNARQITVSPGGGNSSSPATPPPSYSSAPTSAPAQAPVSPSAPDSPAYSTTLPSALTTRYAPVSSAPAPAPAPASMPPSASTPVYPPPAGPASNIPILHNAAGSAGACTAGTTQCAPDGSGYQQCAS
ncbi:hypothetical protein GGI12_005356, partial [Dipsacomyces acuminosporus]